MVHKESAITKRKPQPLPEVAKSSSSTKAPAVGPKKPIIRFEDIRPKESLVKPSTEEIVSRVSQNFNGKSKQKSPPKESKPSKQNSVEEKPKQK